MIVRGWYVVAPLTVITWLASTWGMALVVCVLAWWVSYVLVGGMRHGVVVHGLRNPLEGFGEEPPPTVGDDSRG